MVVLLKRILLIRHAECEMNLHVKGFIGEEDDCDVAVALGRQLSKQYPQLATASGHQLVHSSTAVRAANTAAIALAQLKGSVKPQLQQSPELLELSQGEWEGKPRSECYTPEVLQQIQADNWNFAAPGGESQKQLEERVVKYVKEVVLPNVQNGGLPALVVSHGLAIKCFLRYILGSNPSMTWKIQLDNTAITEVMWCESGPAAGWHLGRVNDVTHLALAGLHPAAAEQYVAVQEAEGEVQNG